MSKRLGLGLPCSCQCPVSRQHPNWIVLVVANFMALKKNMLNNVEQPVSSMLHSFPVPREISEMRNLPLGVVNIIISPKMDG